MQPVRYPDRRPIQTVEIAHARIRVLIKRLNTNPSGGCRSSGRRGRMRKKQNNHQIEKSNKKENTNSADISRGSSAIAKPPSDRRLDLKPNKLSLFANHLPVVLLLSGKHRQPAQHCPQPGRCFSDFLCPTRSAAFDLTAVRWLSLSCLLCLSGVVCGGYLYVDCLLV